MVKRHPRIVKTGHHHSKQRRGLSRRACHHRQKLRYNLGAAAEYRLGSNMILGGSFGMDNAQDYKQWTGGLYLRYTLEDFTGRMPMPVNPYLSPYSN